MIPPAAGPPGPRSEADLGRSDVPPVLPPPLPAAVPARSGSGRGLRVLLLVLVACAGLALVLNVGKLVRAGDSTTGWDQAEAGVSYRNDRIGRMPWSIHIVRVDRGRKDLEFFAALATTKVLGVSRISEQARSVPADIGRAIAGVNGDFYERDNRTYAGDPRGLQIVRGELVSGPDTVCVWFDPTGNPHLH